MEPNERTEFATSLSNDGGSLEHAALVAVAVGRSGDESPSECGSARMRRFSREGAEFPLSKNFFWVTIGAELRTCSYSRDQRQRYVAIFRPNRMKVDREGVAQGLLEK